MGDPAPALIVLNPRTYQAIDQAVSGRAHGPLLLNQAQRRMQRHNAAAVIRRLAATAGIARRVTPHALRRPSITVGLVQGVALRETRRAARHAKADVTVGYDQSERRSQGSDIRPHGRRRPLTSRFSRYQRLGR